MERPLTVLLVDDEPTLRRLVAQFLDRSGYRVVEAGDGYEGLARFEEAGPFDLILSDLLMPRMDGLEFCQRIKRRHPDQPIIVCSAAVTAEQQALLKAEGITRSLTKPYHPDTLLEHIDAELAQAAPV
jgi:CheY-like chemotaxis protein